jgi:hypothetical protein
MKKVYAIDENAAISAEDAKKVEDAVEQQKIKEAVEEAARKKEVTTSSAIEKTATKSIKCNACAWLKINLNPNLMSKLTEEEAEAVRSAKKNNFMIVKGQKFIRQRGSYDNKPFISKFLPEIHDICVKYNLYSYQKN